MILSQQGRLVIGFKVATGHRKIVNVRLLSTGFLSHRRPRYACSLPWAEKCSGSTSLRVVLTWNHSFAGLPHSQGKCLPGTIQAAMLPQVGQNCCLMVPWCVGRLHAFLEFLMLIGLVPPPFPP